jgi:hypothetical protein
VPNFQFVLSRSRRSTAGGKNGNAAVKHLTEFSFKGKNKLSCKSKMLYVKYRTFNVARNNIVFSAT